MINRKKYKYIFVVLVYRNTSDLIDFFHHFDIPDSNVVVVNSFYDADSEQEFSDIANRYSADFISVPNKGYGAGNNKGVEYALAHYDFKYLIISNADITIEKLNINDLSKYGNSIIAPKILNLRGRNQNPSSPFFPGNIYSAIKAWCFNGNHHKLIWGVYAYSRFTKIIYYLMAPFHKKIFSAHGAFVIIPHESLTKLVPLYDEEMFLFIEEEYLGLKAHRLSISTMYAPEIVIRHKEDGSMNLANVNTFEREKQSYLVYYNHYKNRK
ncbi:MAG: hypothetical protein WCR36_00995 [Bacteroidaceae bacterium]